LTPRSPFCYTSPRTASCGPAWAILLTQHRRFCPICQPQSIVVPTTPTENEGGFHVVEGLDLTEFYGLLRLCREAIRYRPHSVSNCLAARVAADLGTWAGRPAEMLNEQIAGPIVDLATLAV
jgi:hypothetical protein